MKLVFGHVLDLLDRETFMDWLYFVDWRRRDLSRRLGRYREADRAWISDAYQRRLARRLLEPMRPVLRHPVEEPVAEVVERLRPVYDPALGTEAVLTMARIIELAGTINMLPFSCLPGLIVSCMGPRVRDLAHGVPWVDVACDGQKETNLTTRLEAFMRQARQYRLQRGQAQRGVGSARTTWLPTVSGSRAHGLYVSTSRTAPGTSRTVTGSSPAGSPST